MQHSLPSAVIDSITCGQFLPMCQAITFIFLPTVAMRNLGSRKHTVQGHSSSEVKTRPKPRCNYKASILNCLTELSVQKKNGYFKKYIFLNNTLKKKATILKNQIKIHFSINLLLIK